MRRTTLLVTFAFLAGLGTGYYARSAGLGVPHKPDPHAADLAAIENSTRQTLPPLTQAPASPN
jgi:hypothetical protein